ncbi:hypothetical protein RPMA_21610 [Tardiphaga alba]|uniref:Uncharacterized protein n=1 Tax=Tardiphaga alba TaxID=340268 RepID=A0ABX8AEU5_9BRAD|nr:hypothetical protein [Tardiphaga alba]QUS41149.1 hypothetical protein RPMA_21610 [Tardiphaga alba]
MSSQTSVARLSDRIIDAWRTGLGLIVATIAAPPLTGIIYTCADIVALMNTGHVADAAGGVLMVALLFLVTGFTTALRITACIVLPGIVLMRWMGLASPAFCTVAGGFAAVTGTFIFFHGSSTRIDTDIDWLLIASVLGAGMLVALLYWWIAERRDPT